MGKDGTPRFRIGQATMIWSALLVLACLPLAALADPFEEAAALVRAGEYSVGISRYRVLLAESPGNYEARIGLARALAFADSLPAAIAAYDTLLARFPQDVDGRLGRGRAVGWAGRYAEAEADLLWVVRTVPTYGDAWSALGDLYLWTARTAEAVESYSRWAVLDPASPAPLLARAKAWRAARRFPLARKDLLVASERGAEDREVSVLLRSLDRVASDSPWELGLSLGREEGAPAAKIQVGRTFAGGSLAVEGRRIRRRGQGDGSVALDGYLDLWRRGYGNLRTQLSGEGGDLPRLDLSAELFQGLARGWEVSASGRRLEFAGTGASIFAVGVSRSVGSWFLRTRSLLAPSQGRLGLSQAFACRRYLGRVDDYLEAGGAVGRAPRSVQGRADLQREIVCSFRGQRLFGQLGIAGATSYEQVAGAPDRAAVSVGGFWRW